MAVTNGYCTLAEYKAYVTARGQTETADASDDGVIQDLIVAASRHIDVQSRHKFYPTIETHLFDIPSGRDVYIDDDLLSVLTFSNGNGNTITDYILKSKNPPYWCISLRDIANITWETNSDGSSEQVISLLGYWGYHEQYIQRAWAQVGTLSTAITDTSTLAFSVTSGHSIAAGNIVRIDNEIYNVVTAATNTITPIKRADNGSTAATHLINTPVYAWQPMEGAKQATIEITNSAYQRRFGRNTGESATVTGAGVVLTPRDIPATAQAFIDSMSPLL